MSIEKEDIAWSTGALFICEKCGKALPDLKLKEEGSAPENLKRWLKHQMKEAGHGKDIRVMTSSCMDICETNRVTLTYIPREGAKGHQKTFTVHPEEDRQEVLAFLKNQL